MGAYRPLRTRMPSSAMLRPLNGAANVIISYNTQPTLHMSEL